MPLSLPTEGDAQPLVIARPNRSATPRLLAALVGLLALVSLVVVLFSLSQGNVMAPPFAILNVMAFGGALALAWRRGDDEDRVRVAGDRVEVTRCRRKQAECSEFNLHWVRVWMAPGLRPREHQRLLIGSHGRAIELGSFLNDEEREAFEAGLKSVLAEAGRPPWLKEQSWV